MTDTPLPQILTPGEVAEYLKVDEGTVLQQLEVGKLKGFKIGSEWRCLDSDVRSYIDEQRSMAGISGVKLLGVAEIETTADFTEIGPYDFGWPQHGGGSYVEHYDRAYDTTRKINGRHFTFRIAFGKREVAGQLRRRVTVWGGRRPLVEFAGSNNFDTDGLLAGIIKLEDNTQLSPYQEIPAEYKTFKVARYDSIVQGPYASTNMGVVVHKDDLESMVRHAIIRARFKKLV